MNRWAKVGVLDRLFAALQREQLIRVKIEAVSLDSPIVKVHQDGTGALKKWISSHRQVPRQLALDLGFIPAVPPQSRTASSCNPRGG